MIFLPDFTFQKLVGYLSTISHPMVYAKLKINNKTKNR